MGAVAWLNAQLLLLLEEMAQSRALLPCLLEPVAANYTAPVPDEFVRAASALLQERRAVYGDLRQLRKVATGLTGHTAM